jgi:hypothetical protein
MKDLEQSCRINKHLEAEFENNLNTAAFKTFRHALQNTVSSRLILSFLKI